MSKPREWFLNGAAWAPEGRLIAYAPGETVRQDHPSLHVIERSAYEKAVEALKYYAEISNYVPRRIFSGSTQAWEIRAGAIEDLDKGLRARQTLEELGEI